MKKCIMYIIAIAVIAVLAVVIFAGNNTNNYYCIPIPEAYYG